jgi:hypothetical protein
LHGIRAEGRRLFFRVGKILIKKGGDRAVIMEGESRKEILVKVIGRNFFRTDRFEENGCPDWPGGKEVEGGGLKVGSKLRVVFDKALPDGSRSFFQTAVSP